MQPVSLPDNLGQVPFKPFRNQWSPCATVLLRLAAGEVWMGGSDIIRASSVNQEALGRVGQRFSGGTVGMSNLSIKARIWGGYSLVLVLLVAVVALGYVALQKIAGNVDAYDRVADN